MFSRRFAPFVLLLIALLTIAGQLIWAQAPALCGGKPLAGGGTLSRHVSSRQTPPQGRQLLVIVDESESRYSTILGVLRSKGYALSISRPQNRSLRLWNEAKTHYIYDAILLLSPQAASFGPGLTAKALLDFVDANRTLILTASSSAGALVRSLADGIGLELDEKGTVLLDHVQALRSTADGTRTTPSTFSVEPAPCPLHKSVSAAPFWEKDMPQQPLVFANAIGAMPSPKQDLLRPILCAPPTSYSYEAGQVIETDEDAAPFAVGTEAMLVGALHGRYGGRVLFIASSDALEDRFMSDSYGNRAYFTDLMTWALGERGILRVARAEHWKVGTSARRETVKHYRIGDRLHLELCVEEWDGRLSEQTWQPWLKGEDLQLEWVMLDPYVRIRMQRNTESGCYTAEFDTPFKHGLFKFRIEHFRDGYTPLLFAQVVPMHPFWHNEYPRLLPRAYPYYAALFTVMFAFWIVAYALLWGNFRYLRKTRASSTPASAREATFSAGAAKSEPGDRGETHRKQD